MQVYLEGFFWGGGGGEKWKIHCTIIFNAVHSSSQSGLFLKHEWFTFFVSWYKDYIGTNWYGLDKTLLEVCFLTHGPLGYNLYVIALQLLLHILYKTQISITNLLNIAQKKTVNRLKQDKF